MSNVQHPTGDVGKLHKDFQSKVSTVPDVSSHLKCSTKYKEDPAIIMKCAEWHGTENIKLTERPAPTITDDHDCIVRITSTTICGSDLHMYFNQIPGSGAMKSSDIMGHEGCGYVTAVGPAVKNVKVGDRVAISALISCGCCNYCQKEQFSLCECTNPGKAQEKLYGHHLTGIFGYTHQCGGYAGLQAEYARVPFADMNTLKITSALPDEKILPLSDILCTGYHGNELARVKEGSKVIVWGCGPVGLMAAYMALFRKAAIVISIDNHPHRLELAKRMGARIINFDEVDVKEEVMRLLPSGPDCCIDCVGYRFPKRWSQWFQQKLHLQSDAVDILDEAIYLCGKGGTIGLIGDYFGTTNNFPIGAFMEKSLTMSGGQLFCQKYWKLLLNLIEKGDLDPSFVFTHTMKFDEIVKAYDIFANVKDNCVKILLKTDFGLECEKKIKQ